jgi:hypothetical protein
VRQAKSTNSCREKNPTQAEPSQQPGTECTQVEVTKSVKLQEGRRQTATQVKVLSPVIVNVKEADSFHLLEGSKRSFDKARNDSLFRGLSLRYGVN